ncbi:MAG: hypothetical protein Q7S64_03400 [bacterium]|nr:hypothetical protein [bacterium]
MKRVVKLIVGLIMTLLVVGGAYTSRCRLREKSIERRAQQVLAAIPDTVDSATANAEIAAAAKNGASKAGQYQTPIPESAVTITTAPVSLTVTEARQQCVAQNPLWWQLSMIVILLVGIGVTWRWSRVKNTAI